QRRPRDGPRARAAHVPLDDERRRGPRRRSRRAVGGDVLMAKRVGMLAPMQPELQPIVEQLGMDDISGDKTLYRGNAGDVEVLAMLTLIGMPPAEQATRRMLEHDVDWVMVVGVAGGVDPSIMIGSCVVPEAIYCRATGRT